MGHSRVCLTSPFSVRDAAFESPRASRFDARTRTRALSECMRRRNAGRDDGRTDGHPGVADVTYIIQTTDDSVLKNRYRSRKEGAPSHMCS